MPWFSDIAQKFVPLGFTSAKDIFVQRQQIVHISTGSKELDQLLAGA
jgi:DNA repair protein RAD51